MPLILAVTIMTILAGFFFYTALNLEIHAHMQLRFTYYTMQNTIQPENYKKQNKKYKNDAVVGKFILCVARLTININLC